MNRPDSNPADVTRSAAPVIRPMAVGDLPAVVAIAAACPEAPRWQPANYAPYADAGPRSPLLRAAFVALIADTPIGFAAASLVVDASCQPHPDNGCELDSMAVLPDARRRGAGGALLDAVFAWARQHGARRLLLEVRAGNAAALGLYQRFGLRPEGRRPRYYADPEESALLLGMVVTPGCAEPSFSTEKEVEGGPPQC